MAYTADQVREIRKSTGLSQKMFAVALGVSPHTAEGWERGKGTPKNTSARMLDILSRDSSAISHFIRAVDMA